jgi:hypothetical protein
MQDGVYTVEAKKKQMAEWKRAVVVASGVHFEPKPAGLAMRKGPFCKKEQLGFPVL